MDKAESNLSSGEAIEILGATVAFVGLVGFLGIWIALIVAGLATVWVGSHR